LLTLNSCELPFQFSKARSLNSDGFKIALDLLLKAQIPSSGVAEIPFSFGVRAEGESKLSGKVMVKYVEQLAELYWWKFGPLLFMLALFVLFALVALFLLVTGREFGTWH
jgi:dolichol-phosphate mannosyltransferase